MTTRTASGAGVWSGEASWRGKPHPLIALGIVLRIMRSFFFLIHFKQSVCEREIKSISN